MQEKTTPEEFQIESPRDLISRAAQLYKSECYADSILVLKSLCVEGDLVYARLLLMARSYLYSGSPKDALEYLNEAVTIYPQSENISEFIYICWEELGDTEKSISEIKRICGEKRNIIYDDLIIGLMKLMKFEKGNEVEFWRSAKEELILKEDEKFEIFKTQVWNKVKS